MNGKTWMKESSKMFRTKIHIPNIAFYVTLYATNLLKHSNYSHTYLHHCYNSRRITKSSAYLSITLIPLPGIAFSTRNTIFTLLFTLLK